MTSQRKPLSEKHKKKISIALRKRKLGNHVVKGARIGAVAGAATNGLYGGLVGGLLGGPIGAIGGATSGALAGTAGGALSGSGYGAGTYYVRKQLDKMRGSKRYSYDYSSGNMEVTLEFARGKDKKKRKTRFGKASRSTGGVGRAIGRGALTGAKVGGSLGAASGGIAGAGASYLAAKQLGVTGKAKYVGLAGGTALGALGGGLIGAIGGAQGGAVIGGTARAIRNRNTRKARQLG
jgi:hypothetical protein